MKLKKRKKMEDKGTKHGRRNERTEGVRKDRN
jgi:hypothetical protein